MTLLRYSDITKMSQQDIDKRLSDLKTELIRSAVASQKSSAKTKEIKKAIARILTFNKSAKEALKKK